MCIHKKLIHWHNYGTEFETFRITYPLNVANDINVIFSKVISFIQKYKKNSKLYTIQKRFVKLNDIMLIKKKKRLAFMCNLH